MIACIPTKGRPGTVTWRLYQGAGIEPFHFVEPQDTEEYEAAGLPNIVCIGENDRGVVFVRNFILDWATEREERGIVLSDDDLTGFVRHDAKSGKSSKADASVWHEIDEKMKGLPFEMAGINYGHHCWHEKSPVSVNKKWAEVCAYLKPTEIAWRYDPRFLHKEDRDFVMQTIASGAGVVRWNHIGFANATLGTQPGGLLESYRAGEDEAGAKELVKKWADWARLVRKKQGEDFYKATGRESRIDAKVDLPAFARAMGKIVR
jgi:hypothetical protein